MTHILTFSRTQAPVLPESGCWPVASLDFMQPPLWRSRAQVEHDETLLQPVVYLLLRNASGQIWCYQRRGGDARLDGRCSCGVGGHVDAQDAQFNDINLDGIHPIQNNGCRPTMSYNPESTLRHALLREVAEELGASTADLHDLRLQGLIFEGLSLIGRVHLGVLFTATWLPEQPPQPVAGEALAGLGFRDATDIIDNPQFELWSRLAAQHLL